MKSPTRSTPGMRPGQQPSASPAQPRRSRATGRSRTSKYRQLHPSLGKKAGREREQIPGAISWPAVAITVPSWILRRAAAGRSACNSSLKARRVYASASNDPDGHPSGDGRQSSTIWADAFPLNGLDLTTVGQALPRRRRLASRPPIVCGLPGSLAWLKKSRGQGPPCSIAIVVTVGETPKLARTFVVHPRLAAETSGLPLSWIE